MQISDQYSVQINTLELETLNWVTRFNQFRQLEPIGNIPPAEFEAIYELGLADSWKVG